MTKKQITIDLALGFMKNHYGDDVTILKMELKKDHVNVIWKDTEDDDGYYFSNIAFSRFGNVTELSGGEC